MRQHYVKTTVELPEDLMRLLRMRSIQREQKLKTIKNSLFDTGNRTPVKLRPPINPLDGRPFTMEEMQRAKKEGRL